MSLPEVLLWQILKREPGGMNIRRQHSVGKYVIDFYCAKAKLGFEIDGFAHNTGDRPERDEMRDAAIREHGIEIVRIPASDMLKSPEDVADSIVRYCRR